MKTKKKPQAIESLITTAMSNGMTIEHALFKHKILELIKNTRIYIANPIRTGYVNDTEELVKSIEKL